MSTGPHRSVGRCQPGRRLGLIVATTALVVASGATAALAGGIVGDPQPELANFVVGAAGGSFGSAAALSGGEFVLASPSSSGATISVCSLPHGARACQHVVVLHAHSGDSFFGTAVVLATGAHSVAVVAEDCCTIGADTATVFVSTDNGATFGAQDAAGTLSSIGAGTFAGGDAVVGTSDTSSTQVQAFSPTQSVPVTTVATIHAGDAVDTSITSYHGGVLVASDDTSNTFVEYAKAGSNFGVASSYKLVGTFAHETVAGISGAALLTAPGGSLTGGDRLRLFNGTAFGAPSKVPDAPTGDDGPFTVQQDGGTVHVFFVGRRNGYDAFEDLTTTGAHWTQVRYNLASAIDAGTLAPALGVDGAGLLYETDGTPLKAQPVLDGQSVRVHLQVARVKVGHATLVLGTANPAIAGDVVLLERLKAGRWYPVASTHESGGAFRFRVPGETESYRAVAREDPGLYEYGYSNAVTLVAVR